MREIEEHVMFERSRLVDITLMSLMMMMMMMMPHENINLSHIQRAAPTRETLTLFLAFEFRLIDSWLLLLHMIIIE